MTLPGLHSQYVKISVSDGVARIKLGLADELRLGACTRSATGASPAKA